MLMTPKIKRKRIIKRRLRRREKIGGKKRRKKEKDVVVKPQKGREQISICMIVLRTTMGA